MNNFNEPIDWHHWKHMQEIELWQACLLSLNMNPDTMQFDRNGWMGGPEHGPYIEEDSFPNDRMRNDYHKRLTLLKSNLSKREHFSLGKINMSSPNRCGIRLSEF